MKILLYHQHLQRTSELIEGRLLLLDSTPSIVNTYIATSGLPNNQRFDCLSSLGRGPIPQNSLIDVDCYQVSTTPIYMPGVKGVEGNFYKIDPHEVTIGGVERGDFGCHFDANVPGSSGCVVLRTQLGWQAFEKDMKLLLTSHCQRSLADGVSPCSKQCASYLSVHCPLDLLLGFSILLIL